MSEQPAYRIIGLEAENVKRLKAVSITPTGDVVEITGENRQGKSSILDAIWWALGGTKDVQADPIRHGQDSAHVTLNLGKWVVTRSFTAKPDKSPPYTTTLTVRDADGGKFTNPQTILDALVGDIAFDPMEFALAAEKEPKRAVAMLQALVPDFDFNAADNLNRTDAEERTAVGRERDSLRAQADAIVVAEDVPVTEVDEAALVQQLASAAETASRLAGERAQREARRVTLENMGRTLGADRESAGGMRDRARQLREEADSLDAQAETLTSQVNSRQTQLDEQLAALAALPAVPDAPDTTDLQQQIENARRVNAEVAKADRKMELTEQADAKAAKWDELTAAIAKRNADKKAAIAGANLPVAGLGLAESGVTLNEVPFPQASQAEQLEASVAIAVAMNPRLRVVRIKQGAFLDSNAMKRLGELAAEKNVQVWVETVSSNRAGAVVIEDGEVVVTGQGSTLEKPNPPAKTEGAPAVERHVAKANAEKGQ